MKATQLAQLVLLATLALTASETPAKADSTNLTTDNMDVEEGLSPAAFIGITVGVVLFILVLIVSAAHLLLLLVPHAGEDPSKPDQAHAYV